MTDTAATKIASTRLWTEGAHAMTHASFSEVANASGATPQGPITDAIPPAKDFHLRSLAPLTLLVTWYQRACFRSKLLEDLRQRPEYLSDVGICLHEATTETTRFFWEPVLLRRSRTLYESRPRA